MWMWTEQEKYQRLLKISQKWMEFGTQVEDLDEGVFNAAFKRAQQASQGVLDKLEIEVPETEGFIKSWIELGIFVGFIAGWKDSKNVLRFMPAKAITLPTDIAYTTVDWAVPWAARYAFTATEEVFTKITTPPVSPLIQGFSRQEVDMLRETYERSLSVGYLLGLENVANKDKCLLSEMEILHTFEM
jgi:hypothetical protein